MVRRPYSYVCDYLQNTHAQCPVPSAALQPLSVHELMYWCQKCRKFTSDWVVFKITLMDLHHQLPQWCEQPTKMDQVCTNYVATPNHKIV